MSQPVYRDVAAPLEERVADVLGAMTLDEKLAQLGCLWSSSFVANGVFEPTEALKLMPHGIGQVTRIGGATALRPGESAEFMNAIQRTVIERTRLGIPVFVHEEAVGGLSQRDATVFPQALGLAATWDAPLLERVAGVIRAQMLAVGARLALGPVMDVARDPRWGRVEETYGEDPVLAGTLAAAYVRGLQTDNLQNGVVATGKHFLGYGASAGGRNCGPVHVGPRELREVYAEPFAAAIRLADLAAIMPSYSSVDGVPSTADRRALADLLRVELGFDGLVVSDYWALNLLCTFHRIAASPGEAARLALQAGLDAELPALDFFAGPLKAEVEAGRVPLSAVDEAVRRVLRLKFRLGLFERPYVDVAAATAQFDTSEQRALARRAGGACVVLLQNDGILPLPQTARRIAVIGPAADDQRLLQGDYHYPAHQEIIFLRSDGTASFDDAPAARGAYAPGPYYTPHVTPLAALRAALGDTTLEYVRGCGVLGDDRSELDAAVHAAQGADAAVVVVGGKSGLMRPVTVGEGNDATDLDLTGLQEDLVKAVASTGTPLVVVVMSGRVHTLHRISKCANALLWTAPSGEEGGSGLADILTGHVNPSGRLPVSLPRSVGQVPVHVGKRAASHRAVLHEGYVDCPSTPLFAFGHGLSYTTFAYSELRIRAATTLEPVEVDLVVANTGHLPGHEVVQLYVSDEVASVARPDQMLIGFARVFLEAGSSQRVTFTVHPSRLAYFDLDMRFVTEPGSFSVQVGASSSDIRLSGSFWLQGETVEYRQRDIVMTGVTEKAISCGRTAT